MGTGSLASAADLQRQAEQLRATGTPTAEGLAAIQQVTRTSGLNPAAAGQIATVGRDIGAVLGGDIASGTTALVNALSGGVDEAIRFAQSLNALSGPQAVQARRMAELGQRGEALNLIFGRISETVNGSYRDSLGEGAKAMIARTDAWNRMLDALAWTTVFQGIVKLMTDLANAIERLANGKPPAWLSSLMGASIPGVGALGGYLSARRMRPQGRLHSVDTAGRWLPAGDRSCGCCRG